MSRIRSIHPGQWTDEDFVELSLAGRLLSIGIRNEADDNGVFEWKPVGLKMRLFPADAIDVAALLDELVAANQIMQFEAEGRRFGAIRNFRVYQRPKSPTCQFPTTPEVEKYVGISAADETLPKRGPGRPRKTPDVDKSDTSPKLIPQEGEINSDDVNLIPQKMENNSLMERREGDNNKQHSPETARAKNEPGGEDQGDPPEPAKPLPLNPQLVQAMEAAGMVRPPPDWRDWFRTWREIGAGFDEDVLPAIRRVTKEIADRGGRSPFRMKVFADAVLESVDGRERQTRAWANSAAISAHHEAKNEAERVKEIAELETVIADRIAHNMPVAGLEKQLADLR